MAAAKRRHTERGDQRASITPAPVYNAPGSAPGSSNTEPWYQKKVLGLPVWAILLLVAGLVAYLWWSSQAGSSSITAPSPGSGSTGGGSGNSGGSGGSTGGGSGSSGGSGGGVGSGGTTDPYSPGAGGTTSPYTTPASSTSAPQTHYVVENAAHVTPSARYTLAFPTQPGGGAVYAPQLRRIIQGGSHAELSAVPRPTPATRNQIAVATLTHGGPPGYYAPQLRSTSGGAAPATVKVREQLAVATLTHGGPTGTVRPHSAPHRSAPHRQQAAATSRTVPKPQGTQGHPGVRGATR